MLAVVCIPQPLETLLIPNTKAPKSCLPMSTLVRVDVAMIRIPTELTTRFNLHTRSKQS